MITTRVTLLLSNFLVALRYVEKTPRLSFKIRTEPNRYHRQVVSADDLQISQKATDIQSDNREDIDSN
jgi:hypothetical protein